MFLKPLLLLATLALTALAAPTAGSEEEVFDYTTEPTIEQLVAIGKSLHQTNKNGQPLSDEEEQQLKCDAANMRATLMHFYLKPDVNKAAMGWSQQRQFTWYENKFRNTPNTQRAYDAPDEVLMSEEFAYRIMSYNTMSYCDRNVVENVSGFTLPSGMKLLPGEFSVAAWNLVNDFLYYIAVNPKQKGIIVSFRGSVSRNDWIADLKSWFAPVDTKLFPGAPAKATVRAGIQELTAKLVNDPKNGLLVELDKLTKQHPDFQLVFVGHSLGGGLAVTSFLGVKLARPTWNLRAVYPIGGPIVGNALFSDWLSTTVGPKRVMRIVSSDDIVPYTSDNTWKKDVKPEDLIRQSNESPVIYYTKPYAPGPPEICTGPHDKKCDTFSCTQRHWEHHSWYGGFWMGERYCLMSKVPQVRGI